MSSELELGTKLGMLISAVDTLTTEVNTLRLRVENLDTKLSTGKGMFYGALFASGGLSAGAVALLHKLFP